MKDNAARFKYQIMPTWEDVSVDDIEAFLVILDRGRFIIRYTVGEERLIQIRTFRDHQYLSKSEAESKLPEPPTKPQRKRNQRATKAQPNNNESTTSIVRSRARARSGQRTTDNVRTTDTCGGEGAPGAPPPPPAEQAEEPPYPESPIEGDPDLTYEHFRQRADQVLKARITAQPNTFEQKAAIDLCVRYPKEAERYNIIEDYVRSTHKKLRDLPPTMGQVVKWAPWLEQQRAGPVHESDEEFLRKFEAMNGRAIG
ncbi:MAG: hypothetical protein ACE149_19580 [Armatimonadota bacterium]